MHNQPDLPGELIMFDRQYSWRTAWQVCHWWLLAFSISTMCDWIFPHVVKQWPLGWRVTIVFAEFLALLLFVFNAASWINGMDELQRRLPLAALGFSVSANFFFFLLWLRLEREGFFNAVFALPFWNNTWGISSVAHACALLGGFYGLGFLIFKRRYK